MDELSVTRATGVEAIRPVGPERPAREAVPVDERLFHGPAAGRPEPVRAELRQGDVVVHAYAKFSFDEKSGLVSIKIVDAKTEEVIREIPPERVVRMAAELQALARRPLRARDGGSWEGIDHYV